jgi:uncharacterized protein YodC (DUF2158 family)
MAEFEAGDVVMLKSGGPYMTVAAAAPSGEGLACMWFDGPTLYKGHFHPSTVKTVDEPVAVPNDPE